MRREPQANGPTGGRFGGVVQSVGSVAIVKLIELRLLGSEQFLEGRDAMLEQFNLAVREGPAFGLSTGFAWCDCWVGDLGFDGLGFNSRREGHRFSGGETAALSRRSRRALTGIRPVRAVSEKSGSGGG